MSSSHLWQLHPRARFAPPRCALDVITDVATLTGMTLELKLRKIGNSLGIVLPKEALAHLKIGEGDTVTLTEAQDGVRLSVSNPEFTKTMAVFESLNRRYRNTLRELAK